jgi:regulator of protease activity HflC (stomatin/prohibitin superfamily)
LVVLGVIGVLLLIIAPATVRVIWQYESGVHFRLGRLVGIKAPGVRFMIPFIDTIRKVDTRVVTLDVPAQDAITKDNVTLRVNAVVYFRVVHADQAIVNVADFRMATFQIAQTTLRSVLGKSSLDELLAEREKLNESLREIIDEATEPWGIKVSMVEVKDVELPDAMQRAMAAQAEAERERRAKIIHAEGEYEASQRLADAAKVIGSQPATLQLRYLQTLTTIATERTNTIVFPLPLDILEAFTRNMRGGGGRGEPKSED